MGVSIVSAPNGEATASPSGNDATPAASGTPAAAGNSGASPLVKSVGPDNTALPPVDKPAEAPNQVNDIKPGTAQASNDKEKKPKANLDEQSSSKKKKKKGLGKLNPF